MQLTILGESCNPARIQARINEARRLDDMATHSHWSGSLIWDSIRIHLRDMAGEPNLTPETQNAIREINAQLPGGYRLNLDAIWQRH